MKKIFSFIIPMGSRVEKEEHRVKIVKALFNKFDPPANSLDECDNFYYLGVLVRFKYYFLEEDTVARLSQEEWLQFVDTLKACFIIMGAIKECEEIELGILRSKRDPAQRVSLLYQFYL